MEEGRPSATAMTAARQRAAHMLWDDSPKIFQDRLALGLSGVESESALQATLGQCGQHTPVGPRRRWLKRITDALARAWCVRSDRGRRAGRSCKRGVGSV